MLTQGEMTKSVNILC